MTIAIVIDILQLFQDSSTLLTFFIIFWWFREVMGLISISKHIYSISNKDYQLGIVRGEPSQPTAKYAFWCIKFKAAIYMSEYNSIFYIYIYINAKQ